MPARHHTPNSAARIVVVGGGFTGLAAGYELARRNLHPTVIEAESEVGGLAASFRVGETRLERFYHHWFTSDRHLMDLASELGVNGSLIRKPARTGMYYANSFLRLSSPLDLLRFKPLSLAARLRLGMGLLIARSIQRWEDLDDKSAASWLQDICGEEAYRIVWDPLLRGKFGKNAELISAAWFWSKLRLRGSSRGKSGQEELIYFKGGFAALAEQIVRHIEALGGRIITGRRVTALGTSGGRVTQVVAGETCYPADAVILTVPLPVAAELLAQVAPAAYCRDLKRIRFLANRCLVFELDRALSDLYWINVNDPSFPFVGVIEHTNFVNDEAYAQRHIIYLSRYCAPDDAFLSLSLQQAVAFALPQLKRMFPAFDSKMVLMAHSWQATWAQPIVEIGYRKLVPAHETPIASLYLATMAQVYPQDRGTNFAVRDGRKVARLVAREFAENWDKL